MARVILALLVILPALFAAEKRTSMPYGIPSSSQGAGALAAQYGTTSAGSEQHDKKQFGVNFNSDKGSSNTFTTTNAGLGVSGAQQQQVGGYPQILPQPYVPQHYAPQPYVSPYNYGYNPYGYPQYQYVPQYSQILPPVGNMGGVHAGAVVGGHGGGVQAGAGVGGLGGVRY